MHAKQPLQRGRVGCSLEPTLGAGHDTQSKRGIISPCPHHVVTRDSNYGTCSMVMEVW
jgi:hypothetical protein